MKALALLALAGFGSAAILVARVTYTPFQIAIPTGSAIKVTQDPASIWSYHNQFTATTRPHVERILVDIDGNGRMDSEIEGLRVLITDIQVYADGPAYPIRLKDSQGAIWDASVPGPNNGMPQRTESHFATPLALPVGSDLFIEVGGASLTANIEVHVIGRVVAL